MKQHINKLQLLLLFLQLYLLPVTAMWLKQYEENYHRPRYYNKAHNSNDHVDYNRRTLENRDQPEPKKAAPVFDPAVHKSYYVHILYKGSVICAGALISRRMIMTSARCFVPTPQDPTYEYKAKHMTILTGNNIGNHLLKTPLTVIGFYMPASKGKHRAHDIALLALARKLRGSHMFHLDLYRSVPHKGDTITMAYLDPNEYEISLFETKVVESARCHPLEKTKGATLGKEFFCAENKANKRSQICYTRPGDPLLIDNKLAAINIYGERCSDYEDHNTGDVYYAIRHTITFVQRATDMLRAFTGTGPHNESATLKPTLQSHAKRNLNDFDYVYPLYI